MSNYCTNCKYLEKRTTANESYWKCCMPNARVTRQILLNGNPARLLQCINNNWYKAKVKQQEKRMTTEEMIKVMQGYVDGEQIQVFNHLSQEWNDITNPEWQWDLYKYRIKQEQKYRPLKPEELIELKGKWLKCKDGGNIYMCTGVTDIRVLLGGNFYYPKTLLDNFTYEDGTPCGKLEE